MSSGAVRFRRAVFILFRIAVEAALVDHFERGQQLVDDSGEGPLILDRPPKPVEIGAARSSIQGRQRSTILCAFLGGFSPVKTLAHDHRERIFERRIGADRDIGIAGALKAVVEHRIEIARDALHPARPDRLDARLFDGIENRARGWRLRGQPPVHINIVAGEPQRHRIGMAAQDRGFPRVELCADGSGSRALALARSKPGSAARPRKRLRPAAFLRVARMHAGDRPFERLVRGLPILRRLLVGTHPAGSRRGFKEICPRVADARGLFNS